MFTLPHLKPEVGLFLLSIYLIFALTLLAHFRANCVNCANCAMRFFA